MGEFRVHNVRFYNVEPKAIHCMAYEPDHRKLALSRADSSVEVWNLTHIPCLERVVPGRPHESVESIAWCGQRLFSTGINARVVEYDLRALVQKHSIPVTAGPAWCLAINKQKTHLSAGTEDGYVNIFSFTSDGLQYEKILDKQEGRILCMAWHPSGDHIVTGSVDAVRVWNVHTGHALNKMTTGRSEAKKETIVWCVAVTDDFTIISGDSRGKISFWNGNTGTSSESYQSHKADVLCLALSEDQTSVYCSGVDPLITQFTRITVRSHSGQNGVVGFTSNPKQIIERSQWCRSTNRRIHEHDVRAIALCGDKLFSGGVDSYLAMSTEPKVLVKYPAIMKAPCTVVCPESRCVLLRYTSHLEVWKLGEAESSTQEKNYNNRRRQSGDGASLVNGTGGGTPAGKLSHKKKQQNEERFQPRPHEPLPLTKSPVKLIELRSRKDEHIVCASLSSNAKWLAYSTETLFRLYTLTDLDDSTPRLEKVSCLPAECGPTHRMEFTSDSRSLVIVSQQGQIYSFNLNAGEHSIVLSGTYESDSLLKDTVSFLAVSNDKQYTVAADPLSNIVVWKGEKYHCTLPCYHSAPVSLAIHPQTNNVIVVYTDHKIVEFSLKDRKYTNFSRSLDERHPKNWLARQFPVVNVAFDPSNPEVIVLHDDSSICVLNKQKTLAPTPKMPRLDTRSSLDPQDMSGHAFHSIKKYKHLIYFGWLSKDEVVAVEVNPLRLFKQLPPTLARKRYGM